MRSHPPFAALRAFEAAARHLSFRDAAFELGLTPAAISHQVKQLEQATGKMLFRRLVRRVELTPEGTRYRDAVAPALDSLAKAYAALCADPERSQVTLGAGPIFSSRWLVPRLGEFWSTCPGIDLWLHHSPLPVWRQIAQFDLAVAWGKGNWPGVVCELLLRIEVTPVMSPALQGACSSPADLLALPLLHHRDSAGWQQWFEAIGVSSPQQLPGTVFEDANVLLQATLAGRGVGLGIVPFVEDELTAGRLVQPFDERVDPGDAYYLIYRQGATDNPVTAVLRQWLLASQ